MSFLHRTQNWSAPAIAGLLIAGVWEAALRITNPDFFILPAPSAIVASFFATFADVWEATRNTGYIVISGLIAGVIFGVIAALLVTRFRAANDTITPLAAAINAIPIIALAPIFNAWYGITSARSNQAVVMVLVFFPIFVNTARGLTEVESDQIELMRSYAASEWTITKEVRIPNALPFFFTALKLVSSVAVIAAIVAEYFGGRVDALGPLIIQNASSTRFDDAWAAVVAGSMLGLSLFGLASALEYLAMPWQRDLRGDS